MKTHLITIMQQATQLNQGHQGLHLIELPTGYGKTYNVVRAVRTYLKETPTPRKIIYLTTLNKNLPEGELLAAFDNDEAEYRKNVLRIRSNFDEVTEKLDTLDVPEEFRTERYTKLLDLVTLYNRMTSGGANDQNYIQNLKDRINKAEKAFRNELVQKLSNNFPQGITRTKQAKCDLIRNSKTWQWIGELYPAVFTDDHPILLMSISKFMKRNSCIVEPSYEFLTSDLTENAIIFIDEFDATKATIEDAITEGALAIRAEYLALFRQVRRGLNPSYMSYPMTAAYKRLSEAGKFRYTFEKILEEAQDIETRYEVNLSYKTAEKSIDRKQNFLLKDAVYHTIFQGGKGYISAFKNVAENRINIFFETKEEFHKHLKEMGEESIVVYALLREINRFLIHFRVFLLAWAREYMYEINAHRAQDEDEMTIENAVHSILHKFDLTDDSRQIILSDMRSSAVKRERKELLPDNSFYQKGMEIFEFEDQDTHNDSTNLRLVAVYDTPEKILTFLAEKATVIGISATAEIPSVVGNYDLGYLKEKLGEKFHLTPPELKKRIAAEMAEGWKAYEDGRIRIHAEVVKNEIVNFDAVDVCSRFLQKEELGLICGTLIRNATDSPYHELRYCNIVRAMQSFCSENIQSMLYLGMALPKRNNPELDDELLHQLFELVKNPECSLVILRSTNFDEVKEDLLKRLSKGEKIFIMSSYQTLGAGQNLQYKAPAHHTAQSEMKTLESSSAKLVPLLPVNASDSRHFNKDIDAIYLGDVTNLTANTYAHKSLTEKELLGMLFQIEELKQNAELSFTEAENMIRLAFRSYTGRGHVERNLLYQTDSVRLQATRQVMQAVGRMCRTYLKSRDIFIYIEENLLEKLSAGELKKHILSPEMEAIVRLREALGAEYTNEEEKILREAEATSSFGNWNIRQTLAYSWTQDSMFLWKKLRLTTLRYPTASASIRLSDELIHKLYITSGRPQNRYFYAQNSDYAGIRIDFGDDVIAFRSSERAMQQKQQEMYGDVYNQEMSEEASRLPVMLKYPGMSEYFTANGFATAFAEEEYMMSPAVFNNIYKGVLGEVAGKFILKKELGINLTDITDPAIFEFFDYEMSPGVYIDFKNWKFSYLTDRRTAKQEITRKLDNMGGKRAYIINVAGDPFDYTATAPIDERIIEIPCLLDMQGRPVSESLRMFREEDLK